MRTTDLVFGVKDKCNVDNILAYIFVYIDYVAVGFLHFLIKFYFFNNCLFVVYQVTVPKTQHPNKNGHAADSEGNL